MPWAGRGQSPSQANGLREAFWRSQLVLIAVRCLSHKKKIQHTTGAGIAVSRRPFGRCLYCCQLHRTVFSRPAAMCVCVKSGAGSLLCPADRLTAHGAAQTVFCDGILNSGPIILTSLMQNSDKSTVGAKPFPISCLAFISN